MVIVMVMDVVIIMVMTMVMVIFMVFVMVVLETVSERVYPKIKFSRPAAGEGNRPSRFI